MTVVPTAAAATSRSEGALAEGEEMGHEREAPAESQAQRLYAALSACANLHPDPMSGSDLDVEDDEDDDDGGRGGGGTGRGQRPAIMFEGEQDISGVYPLGGRGGGG